ncbi:DUF423 domain-containing protein [Synechococcus sp. PCC 7336]|uniref:DUF423 domain-containing protein n=1 Tax=Synechococcus sp. PCC 7336 TaxID=195250 RepID=UPI000476F73A|nr:DUF423 domain-containing protein [Synechococcus sp. PCC 7336]
MARLFVLIGAILAGLSVAGGAFGAHALAAQLEENALATFETAARYQMYHALALVAVGLSIYTTGGNGPLMAAGIAFSIGVVFFCGSLYVLSLSGVKILGAVAPMGGLAFMVGWVCLAIASWKLLA